MTMEDPDPLVDCKGFYMKKMIQLIFILLESMKIIIPAYFIATEHDRSQFVAHFW